MGFCEEISYDLDLVGCETLARYDEGEGGVFCGWLGAGPELAMVGVAGVVYFGCVGECQGVGEGFGALGEPFREGVVECWVEVWVWVSFLSEDCVKVEEKVGFVWFFESWLVAVEYCSNLLDGDGTGDRGKGVSWTEVRCVVRNESE